MTLISFCAFAQSGMLMPPYLQAVTQTSIDVLVESSSAVPIAVAFGRSLPFTDSAFTTSVRDTDHPSHVHVIHLSGLTSNTLYHYRARQGMEYSSDATFRTAPPEGISFRFAWMADCRTGNGIHDTIAGQIESANPVVLLYGGDLAATNSYEAFKKDFFSAAELSLIGHVPFFNATGNHEGWKINTRAFTEGPLSESGTDEYYAFDYGDLHVVVLNTQLPYGPGSPQFKFVLHDLATSIRPWKVVIAHKHAYCAGGHGEDTTLKVLTTRVFEPTHVTMVLSGHSHFYQHNLINGIHHLIIGSAGAPLYTPGTEWYTVKSAKSYNFAVGDVSPTALRLIVYDERGMPLDSIILHNAPVIPYGKGWPDQGAAILPEENAFPATLLLSCDYVLGEKRPLEPAILHRH